MTGSKNDIRELVLTSTDIAAGGFTDWITINNEFTVRVVSNGGAFTGNIRVQRRNNEDDINIGTVQVYASDTEQAGFGKTVRGMQFRVGALAGDLVAVPGSIYIALVK